jgi:hypothetical protein
MGGIMSAPREPAVTLPTASHSRPYLIQWERTLRWRRRVEAAEENDHPVDFFLVLFANVFQMRDWLQASKPDLGVAITDCFAASDDLCLLRDIANGHKHMTTTRYKVDGSASVAREYAGAGRVRYVVPGPDGANRDALDLADSCINEIRRFMQTNELMQAYD